MEHPITPPDELVQQWRHQWWSVDPDCEGTDLQRYIAVQASQLGWDQRGAATEAELQQARDEELAACCEWLNKGPYGASLSVNGVIEQLRAARRPITVDQDLAAACREWIKGCTCADRNTPQDCKECTDLFLQAVLDRSRRHGLKIGKNSLEQLND